MEPHRNATRLNAAAAVGGRKKTERSDLLTVKNFGSRTGLRWSEERVVREIAGYVVRSLSNDPSNQDR